ncbi:MAG TPA: RNA polymerase sigma factor [Vicinamibacterales bacterium]|nr:RNA polymerase sigma factor [Vicinamibacterales bacterium]
MGSMLGSPPLWVSDASVPADSRPTDAELMVEARQGSRNAFQLVFERYRGAVWGFFRRRVADASRAEELTQDVFLAVLQGAARYEARGPFRAYLFGIAFNVLMAERRRSGHQESVPIEDDAVAHTPSPDSALWVRRALAQLQPEEREILMLREYEQLSYQELSEVLVVPVNTVRSRLFRARAALKAALEQGSVGAEGEGHGSR